MSHLPKSPKHFQGIEVHISYILYVGVHITDKSKAVVHTLEISIRNKTQVSFTQTSALCK